ncbi:MAG: N-acetyl-gamma-glutamyl-phosphate reductase, partial [Ostreibacterium sp.]
ATKHVQIAIARPADGDSVTILVVEDNLIKGAAGQAIQCLNIRHGLTETLGLEQLATI